MQEPQTETPIEVPSVETPTARAERHRLHQERINHRKWQKEWARKLHGKTRHWPLALLP